MEKENKSTPRVSHHIASAIRAESTVNPDTLSDTEIRDLEHDHMIDQDIDQDILALGNTSRPASASKTTQPEKEKECPPDCWVSRIDNERKSHTITPHAVA